MKAKVYSHNSTEFEQFLGGYNDRQRGDEVDRFRDVKREMNEVEIGRAHV